MFTDDLIGGNYSPPLSISIDLQFVKCELNSEHSFACKDCKLIDL